TLGGVERQDSFVAVGQPSPPFPPARPAGSGACFLRLPCGKETIGDLRPPHPQSARPPLDAGEFSAPMRLRGRFRSGRFHHGTSLPLAGTRDEPVTGAALIGGATG